MVSINTPTVESGSERRVDHVVLRHATLERVAGASDNAQLEEHGHDDNRSDNNAVENPRISSDHAPLQQSDDVKKSARGRRASAGKAVESTTRRTRSQSRIKKRDLEEAAVTSSSEELPEYIFPSKRTRLEKAGSSRKSAKGKKMVEISSDIEVISVVNNSANARFQCGAEDAILVEDSSSDATSNLKLAKKSKANTSRTQARQSASGTVGFVKKEPSANVEVKKELAESPSGVGVNPGQASLEGDDENPFISSPDEMTRFINALRFVHPGDVSLNEEEAVMMAKTLSEFRREKKRRGVPVQPSSSSAFFKVLDAMNISADNSTTSSAESNTVSSDVQDKGMEIDQPSGPSTSSQSMKVCASGSSVTGNVNKPEMGSSAPQTVPDLVEPKLSALRSTNEPVSKPSASHAVSETVSTLSPAVKQKSMVSVTTLGDGVAEQTTVGDKSTNSVVDQEKTAALQNQSTDSPSKASSNPTAPASPVKPKRPTFAQYVNPSRVTPMLSSGSVKVLDDTMKFCVKVLPVKCGVTLRKEQQDSLLANTYEGLPNLSHGILHPWNTGKIDPVMRLVTFSGWESQCPKLDYYNSFNAVTFKRKDNFINPSRASPLEVNILYTSDDRKRAVLQCNNTTAICISPVLSGESHLIEPSPQGLRNKYLTGHFHHQEWERFAGFACMVFDHKAMIAQIREGSLSFGTMGNRADKEYSSPSKPTQNPDILSGQKESKLRSGKRLFKPNVGFKSILDSNDEIPVYDARNYYFDFDKDLGRVSEVLCRYHGEIPSGSFVVVAYTMTQYEKDKSFHLSTNILFAILFATEDMRLGADEDDEDMY